MERAWKAGFDVLMLTVDTWQLGWRPTDINIANYMCAPRPAPPSPSSLTRARSFYYPPGKTGNEIGESDPVFMRKHGAAQAQDTGKWIDSSVWHGKAHTWAKLPWVIKEVCFSRLYRHCPER
jgi:isopentenyl diphosphate isomerase/L-lactate dehydrogenase-like FMN-dependent dehydrogenase